MKNNETHFVQIFDGLFRTVDGKIVIAQFPNWPLWTWLVATILESMDVLTPWQRPLYWIGSLALVWWAYLEIVEGVNGFRRILGSLVLIYIVLSRTQLI